MFLAFGMPLTVRVTSVPSKKYLAPGPDQVPMVCAPRSQRRRCSAARPHFLRKVRHRSNGASLPSTEPGEPHGPSVPPGQRSPRAGTGPRNTEPDGIRSYLGVLPYFLGSTTALPTRKVARDTKAGHNCPVRSRVGRSLAGRRLYNARIMLGASPGTREGFDCGGYARCGKLRPAGEGHRPLGTLAAGWPSRHRGEVALCVGQDWLCRRGSWPRV
jgi:hypothetical protein